MLPDFHTDVDMWFLPLKHCGHSADAIAILGKYLLDRVYSSPLAEGELAGPKKRRKRPHKGRHLVRRLDHTRKDKESCVKSRLVATPN